MKKILITITGPSTAGKSTLANLFKEKGYQEVVSTTTRPQRTGEIEGTSYYFVHSDNFSSLLENQQLVEHANVGKYSYGVSKQAIYDVVSKGIPAVLVIEPNGANNVAEFCKKEGIEHHKVFLNNTMEVLIDRLKQRYDTDEKANEEVYKDRLWNIGMIEPVEWTAKAYSGEHYYDQIFDTFLPDNQHQVVNDILTAVETKAQKVKKNKP